LSEYYDNDYLEKEKHRFVCEHCPALFCISISKVQIVAWGNLLMP